MEIRINVHSFVDVITNSSTEIYMNPSGSAKKMMYNLINTFIAEAGSDKKAEDLYDIETSGEDLIVKPKSDDSNEFTINITDEIYNMYYIDAEYNG